CVVDHYGSGLDVW
nr:immunoglobulin heavy chain junction region [Macaca mulatta]MOV44581.1 immunoglobulin heavy chain junction region [Macaca mulatta]